MFINDYFDSSAEEHDKSFDGVQISTMASISAPLLSVRNLKKYFPIRKGWFGSNTVGNVKAVDGVSFDITRGETLGLVGESGCGKSTTGRTLLRLIEPTDGVIILDGVDVNSLKGKDLRKLRREMQIIFQDPHGSLNPRMRVGEIVREPLDIFHIGTSHERTTRTHELLDTVELPKDAYNRFPHEFSGGQRQRIGIARAIALNPKLIVCDEPISALDVSIQAQVVNLLMRLQSELGLTYLFIAHDLAVVRHISTRVAVMYLGKIVEIASAADIYDSPMHPYTLALLSAIPVPDPTIKIKNVPLIGEVPSAAHVPAGCRFHPRCPFAEAMCLEVEPELEAACESNDAAHITCDVDTAISFTHSHLSACHLRDKVYAKKSIIPNPY